MKKFTKIIVLAIGLSLAVPVITQAQPPAFMMGHWFKKAGNNIWFFVQEVGGALAGW